MATYRPRPSSPPGSRRHADPRNSTPTVIASSFDTPYTHAPRASIDTLTAPRVTAERLYDAQPITKRVYPATGYSGTKSKTEYAVRPRHNALAEDRRRPPTVVVPPHSTNANRPLVKNAARDRPRSPPPKARQLRDDLQRFVYPAVTSPRQNHQHHYRGSSGDVDRLSIADRDRRDRKVYHNQRGNPTSGALVRHQNEDDDFSYTGPREQFARDYPDQGRSRRSSYTRQDRPDRPTSVIDYPDWQQSIQARREPGPAPPPSSRRQFDRIDKSEGRRIEGWSGAGSDSEIRSDVSRARHSTRAPIALHHQYDDGYSSQRDDYDDRRHLHYDKKRPDDDGKNANDRDPHRRHSTRHRKRRESRSGNESPDRGHIAKELSTLGVGGVVAESVSGGRVKGLKDKSIDTEDEARRDRRHRRHRERAREQEEARLIGERAHSHEPLNDRVSTLVEPNGSGEQRPDKSRRERSDSDSLENSVPGHRHHHRRRRHRPEEDATKEVESETSLEVEGPAGINEPNRSRPVREKDYETSEFERHRPHNKPRDHELDIQFSDDQYTVLSPVEVEEERPKRVQVVEPTKETDSELKPKGILKPPRQVPFPEDPNPTREGVAPLKDAGKKGIPPGARWTKINRMLVNPAALEAKHERFEERDDYVIVLRVLTREEIQKLADKTKEIRDAREKEWQERKRREKEEKMYYGSSSSSDEEGRPPLAIEAPPMAPAADPRMFPGHAFDTRPAVPDMAGMAGMNPRPE